MSRRSIRWTDLSRSTRRRIDQTVEKMRERERQTRRVSRTWVPVRIRKDGDE